MKPKVMAALTEPQYVSGPQSPGGPPNWTARATEPANQKHVVTTLRANEASLRKMLARYSGLRPMYRSTSKDQAELKIMKLMVDGTQRR